MTRRQHDEVGRATRPVPSVFRSAGLVLFIISSLWARPLPAQLFERPWLHWRTISAGRFEIHYPLQLGSWARFVAARMPAIDSAVTGLVGFSPRARVQIVIEDPADVANGFAFTFVDQPVIVFWASPPDPRESIGEFWSWGEMLAVHEFAHVAHLARPSRNPATRLLWRLAPVHLGPLALRAPRWVIEGYATYVEGRITGSGRPHGFWRPAILRQWAIEGRLPTYAELSTWSDFEGGSFAYLAGSAFLEWLVRRGGDSSLVHVWRRLSARQTRGFAEAFAGVYGDSPENLYGRFAAELTASAMATARALDSAGVVDGEMIQHLAWATGDPAISPDGSRVALVLRSRARPPRVVVWRTLPEPDTLEARARQRLLRRDPEDVPARRVYPPPKRALATLLAKGGRAYQDPRWLSDGERVLVWRSTRQRDGSLRPDLYVWNVKRRSVRQLTHGTGVRDADPSPDGRSAVALRCESGHCDVVAVDLGNASVRTLVAGDELTSFARPRLSPNGRRIAFAMQRENRWRIATLDLERGAPTFVDPDDGATRFDPTWVDDHTLIVASDRSGTANLERLELVSSPANVGARARELTRVTGAAVAPAFNRADSSIWFLALHSHGYDVRRLRASVASPSTVGAPPLSPLLDTRYAPAVPVRSTTIHAFAAGQTSPPRRYALGPRTTRWFPAAAVGATGRAVGLALVNTDVVGRLSLLAQSFTGNGAAWHGGALEAAWRGTRPTVRASVFLARTTDQNRGESGAAGTIELRGADIRSDFTRAFDMTDVRLSVAVAPQQWRAIAPTTSTVLARQLATAEARATFRHTGDGSQMSESITAHGTIGRVGGGPEARFQRMVISGALRASAPRAPAIDLRGSYGALSRGASLLEQFAVGGLPSTMIDSSLLSQRVSMPALPGVISGDRLFVYRVATTFGPLQPYFWGTRVWVGDSSSVRQRVVGAELAFEQNALPVLGTPEARVVAGVGYTIDAPFTHLLRGYLAVTLRP